MSAEVEPQPSVEEQILNTFGYSHCLDMQLTPGDQPVLGRNFLLVYGASPHREETENLLYGFLGMDASDPDYAATKQVIAAYLGAYFGDPVPSRPE
jgi:hypothetical protein